MKIINPITLSKLGWKESDFPKATHQIGTYRGTYNSDDNTFHVIGFDVKFKTFKDVALLSRIIKSSLNLN